MINKCLSSDIIPWKWQIKLIQNPSSGFPLMHFLYLLCKFATLALQLKDTDNEAEVIKNEKSIHFFL